MKLVPTEIPEILLICPDVHQDHRGFFLESFHARKYAGIGILAAFVQDNHSQSLRNTIRGLHAQRLKPQGKLLRVVKGEIFDVAVDIRPGSGTFARWVGVSLSASSFQQLYIPPGFAHGFAVLSDLAEIEYKCTEFYDPSDEITIRWNDPDLGIAWPITDPILSYKDSQAPTLQELLPQLSPSNF
jgi:dTDP-4-dehydrorhamnose 3,5-epimerase